MVNVRSLGRRNNVPRNMSVDRDSEHVIEVKLRKVMHNGRPVYIQLDDSSTPIQVTPTRRSMKKRNKSAKDVRYVDEDSSFSLEDLSDSSSEEDMSLLTSSSRKKTVLKRRDFSGRKLMFESELSNSPIKKTHQSKRRKKGVISEKYMHDVCQKQSPRVTEAIHQRVVAKGPCRKKLWESSDAVTENVVVKNKRIDRFANVISKKENYFRSNLKTMVSDIRDLEICEIHMAAIKSTPFWFLFDSIMQQDIDTLLEITKKHEDDIRFILKQYDTEQKGFRVGNSIVELCRDDIVALFGVRDGDIEIQITRDISATPWMIRCFPEIFKRKHQNRTPQNCTTMFFDKLQLMGRLNDHKISRDVARLLHSYMLSSFFLPNGNTSIAWSICEYLEVFGNIVEFDWSSLILNKLVQQIEDTTTMKLSGCAMLLPYFICEHTNIIQPRVGTHFPRFLRWHLNKLHRVIEKYPAAEFSHQLDVTHEVQLSDFEKDIFKKLVKEAPSAAELKLGPGSLPLGGRNTPDDDLTHPFEIPPDDRTSHGVEFVTSASGVCIGVTSDISGKNVCVKGRSGNMDDVAYNGSGDKRGSNCQEESLNCLKSDKDLNMLDSYQGFEAPRCTLGTDLQYDLGSNHVDAFAFVTIDPQSGTVQKTMKSNLNNVVLRDVEMSEGPSAMADTLDCVQKVSSHNQANLPHQKAVENAVDPYDSGLHNDVERIEINCDNTSDEIAKKLKKDVCELIELKKKISLEIDEKELLEMLQSDWADLNTQYMKLAEGIQQEKLKLGMFGDDNVAGDSEAPSADEKIEELRRLNVSQSNRINMLQAELKRSGRAYNNIADKLLALSIVVSNQNGTIDELCGSLDLMRCALGEADTHFYALSNPSVTQILDNPDTMKYFEPMEIQEETKKENDYYSTVIEAACVECTKKDLIISRLSKILSQTYGIPISHDFLEKLATDEFTKNKSPSVGAVQGLPPTHADKGKRQA